ncbi:hypothetical protein [uncultured Cocleimonas sp.]|uniref:hypothetical protein n=1 Tax=uncultured Cocleimonas sp. TaxID=1051587 RepID=UPI002637EE0D|nr:hypothetical protein [uncultured Cocleimonas sp.]
MKKYDNSKPLILIHVPKTAGISIKEIYKSWFGNRLLFHYSDGNNTLPPRHSLKENARDGSLCVYGHFNRAKKFGVEHYYPEVNQFVTIIREPFEMAVSGYFYVRKTNPNWRDQLNLQKGGLREYLESMHSGLLNFFPQEVTNDNYVEIIEAKYVEIGVTEFLSESIARIAEKLNQQYSPEMLKHLNVAKRDLDVPYELKESFMNRHKLEYSVYNYVLNKFI